MSWRSAARQQQVRMQEQGCFPEAGARGNADERAFPTPWTVGTGSDRPIRASAATAAHHGARR
jgi:hypothetical protein